MVAAALSATAFALLTPLNDTGSAATMLGSLLVYLPFCLIGEVLIGLPIFLAMLKLNMIRWWIWLPLSLVLGLLLGLLMGGVPSRDGKTFIATLSVAVFSAVAFRLVLAMSKGTQREA
ncbi:hypothetical protein RugamoR57_04940 [Duganella caerulea]